MTFSFLWWLSIVNAHNVKKKNKQTNKQTKQGKKKRLVHGTYTLLIEVGFIFVWAFLVRGRKIN